MTCGIYEIVNRVNGKRYVGSAVNFAARWRIHRHHLRTGKHHSIALQRAWDKHGEESFNFKVIEQCGRQYLMIAEQKHIDIKSEYNSSPTASSSLGVVRSEKTKELLSEITRNKWKDDDFRNRVMSARREWVPSEDWRKSASLRLSGENSGMFNPEKLTFCHKDHGCITETIWWFGKEFGLNKSHLRAMTKENPIRHQHKGWTIKKAPEGA